MRESYINSISTQRYRSQAEWAFRIMLFMVWTRPTVLTYVITIIRRLPVVGLLADYIYPAVICGLIVFSMPYIKKRIRPTELLLYLAIVAVLLITNAVYSRNSFYIEYYFSDILWSCLPMLFLGACYDHDSDEKILFWASVCSMIARVLYQNMKTNAGQALEYDSMHAAYLLLPSVMYLIYWAFTHGTLPNWLLAGASIVFMFAYGTRGPILNIIIFLGVGFLYVTSGKKTRNGALLRVMVTISVVVLVGTDILEVVAESLSELFQGWGMSTRIFDYYLKGEIGDSSGRDRITEYALEAISRKPLFGYGLMGDRALMGTYAHHFFLEIWMEFGVLFGTGYIVALAVLLFRACRNQWKNKSRMTFLLMIVCMNMVKLLMSGSYIIEPYFFFMIGVMIAAKRDNRSAPVTA